MGPTTFYLARAPLDKPYLTNITTSLPMANEMVDNFSLGAARAGRGVGISDCAATDAQ